MSKILTTEEAVKIAQKLRKQSKTLVLVGGCFDILHSGHIEFLAQAKKQGNALFVLLENDQAVRALKGNNRPINTQGERAKIIASLSLVDFVILLPRLIKDAEYDNLVMQLKPAIIATTKGDPNRRHKERQAGRVDAKVIDVITRIPNVSTSRIATLLKKQGIL